MNSKNKANKGNFLEKIQKEKMFFLRRNVINDESWEGFLRLDLNEVVPHFNNETFDYLLTKLKPSIFSSYPDLQGVYTALSAYLGNSQDHLIITSGSDAGIRQIIQTFCNSNDSIIVTYPTFGMYWVYSQIFDLEYHKVNYTDKFKISVNEIIEKIESIPKTKLVIIANPNGAIGCVIPLKSLKKIIRSASRNGVVVLLDETYIDFFVDVFGKEIDSYDNLILIRSFSKAWGMAGLRFGYILTNPNLRNWVLKADPYIEINGVAAVVAEYLLMNPDIVSGYVESTKLGGEYLANFLRESGFDVYFGDSNFLLVKFGKLRPLILRELERKKIKVMDLSKRDLLHAYTRITVGPKIHMEPVVEAIKGVLVSEEKI